MKNKAFRYWISALACTLTGQFASGQKIEGYVHNTADEPVPFANVVLYSLPDSTFVTGTTSDDHGHFIIEGKGDETKSYFLRISNIGFKTATLGVRENVGVIFLEQNVTSINEVTIKGHRPVVRQVEGRLLVNVSGTALSKAGNVFDALRRSPGLLVDSKDQITVFGKGTPLIFLNGREVKNTAEIANLQSCDIASIEIDRNPSAEYSASGNAIIKITTKKITGDRLNFQLYNYSYIAKRYSDFLGTNLNGKLGNTDFTVNYSYRMVNYKNFEDAYEINTQDAYVINNRNSAVRYPSARTNNLYASVSQKINSKHTIEAQVTLIREDDKERSHTDQTIDKTDTATVYRDINKNSNGSYDLSTYSLNYLLSIDSVSSLSVISDYSEVSDVSLENIEEYNLSDQSSLNTLLDGKNNYEVYSAKLDFKTSVFNRLGLKTGGKFSHVNKNGKTVSTNAVTDENNYTDSNSINDRIGAVYIKANYKLNPFSLGAGLRYERTSTNVESGHTTVLDSVYGNWFPSVSVNKEFSNKVSLTLSYIKKIDRPSFDELSTDVTYLDANSYSVGNPRIKPTLKNSFSLDLSMFSNLILNIGYRKEKNPRILTAVNDEDDPDIIKYTPVNLDKAKYFFANVDYSLSQKWYGNTVSFGIEKPNIEIPFLNEIRKAKKLCYFFMIDNNFTLSGRTSALINFVYHSDQEELMTYWKRYYNLSIGFDTSFWNDKLKVSLLARDLLNTSDTPWEDRYGNIISGSVQDLDNSWIRLVIKYNFNNFKSGIKKKSAGEEELDRM